MSDSVRSSASIRGSFPLRSSRFLAAICWEIFLANESERWSQPRAQSRRPGSYFRGKELGARAYGCHFYILVLYSGCHLWDTSRIWTFIAGIA